MKNVKTLSIGANRGAPRIWLEGRFPELAGFLPGSRFRIEIIRDRDCLALRLDDVGTRVVSAKTRGERSVPVIDLNSKEALSVFEGLSQVRAVSEGDVIYLLPLASEARTKERISRLRSKLAAGEPLAVGSVSHGGGVLSMALHEGMESGGIETRLAFANDIRDDLLEHASAANPAWDARTVSLSMPMQELAFDHWTMSKLEPVEILEAGIPCEGASKAGRSKNGNVCVESHERVGHLVAAFLAIVARSNPSVVILENVVPYRESASSWIIRNQLRDLGYDVQETVFEGDRWGALEHRERMCLVAVTHGIGFDLSAVSPGNVRERTLGEILDPVPDDSPTYREVGYLKSKEEKDRAAGKGFSVPYLTRDAKSVPTLRKGYHKGGSCDARVLHPTLPHLSRLLTTSEHARAKGIPERLVDGLTQTAGHELLGQSVLFEPFKALGTALALSIRSAPWNTRNRTIRNA